MTTKKEPVVFESYPYRFKIDSNGDYTVETIKTPLDEYYMEKRKSKAEQNEKA